MADYLVTDTELTSVANAIRTKGGTSASLSFPTEFVSAINAIEQTLVEANKVVESIDGPTVITPSVIKSEETIATKADSYSYITKASVDFWTGLSLQEDTKYRLMGRIRYYSGNAGSFVGDYIDIDEEFIFNGSTVTIPNSITFSSTCVMSGFSVSSTSIAFTYSTYNSRNGDRLYYYDLTLTKIEETAYDAMAQVTIENVSGGGGLEYEEGTWMPNEDIARGTITFLNTHTTAPSIVEITDTDTATAPATYSNISMIFYNVHTLHGDGFPYNTTSTYYGVAQYLYYSSSQSASGQRTFISSSTGSAYPATPEYWADATAIYPYTGSTSRYWRAGRTYKWIAIWK